MGKVKKSWRAKLQTLKGAEVQLPPTDERWHPETECFICGEPLRGEIFTETKTIENPVKRVTEEITFKYHQECWDLEGASLDEPLFISLPNGS
jgi:hypothetical protein